MEHVLWIGGPPAAGKTTVATHLARRYGLRLYRADTRTWAHRDRALLAGNSAAMRWEALSPAGRWERPTPAELLEMSLHRERGSMVIDDVRALPTSPLIVAEGSTLPASAVSSGAIDRTRAVWLLPTREFQRAQLDAAGTPAGPAGLYRDLAALIEVEARASAVTTLIVDGSKSASEMTAAVEQLFAPSLARGPHAETRAARQPLLREMNDATIAQVRGYYARPWSSGEAEVVEQYFACECGEPGCEADVHLTVGEFSVQRAFAPGHGEPD